MIGLPHYSVKRTAYHAQLAQGGNLLLNKFLLIFFQTARNMQQREKAFFAVNIVSIGYFQSVERARPAMIVTVLRGFVFMVLCLLGLPLLLKVPGIWLAVPLAEILTFLVIMVIYYRKHQWVRR